MRPVSAPVLLRVIDLALKADVDRLQAFHMQSLRRMLRIRWFDYTTNAEIKKIALVWRTWSLEFDAGDLPSSGMWPACSRGSQHTTPCGGR